DHILEKMLARQPEKRYQTASELIVELERSNLAARVPSFVKPELATREAAWRARLQTSAQPTQPALRAPVRRRAPEVAAENCWYIRYRNREGRWCKSRITTEQILQRLQARRLSSSVEASRDLHGEFRPLSSYPEFGQTAPASRSQRECEP